MTARALGTLLSAYFLALLVACSTLRAYVAISQPDRPVVVRTVWRGGARAERAVFEGSRAPPPERDDTGYVVDEAVVGESAMPSGKLLMPYSLVAGRDGVAATLDGKTAYATADDLLAAQAYDRATTFVDASFGVGAHRAAVVHLLAEQLGVSARDVERRAAWRRVRFERQIPDPPPRVTARDLTAPRVTEAVREAAQYLARSVDERGRFRYLVDATTNRELTGYNWPRHSGATYFLAQAAALLDDSVARYACLRAASLLRDDMMQPCGEHACIAAEAHADVGSSALALIAFAEIARTGADRTYAVPVSALAAFLRSQQRPDGELMHLYDRAASRPVDVQLMYYTGEAALALSRAHLLGGDPRDLDAARRALSHLSGRGWSFFGSRYYFGEEHWTCQAVADLWDRAPNEEALSFCLRWHEYQRRLQYADGDSPFDAEGAFGFGPMASPRVTPAASRGEAGVAALDVLLRERAAGRTRQAREIPELTLELDRAAAFVLRHQLVPGNAVYAAHLLAAPDAVRGAFPGSAVDWQLRIDYAQHAGSMLVRWLEVTNRTTARAGD